MNPQNIPLKGKMQWDSNHAETQKQCLSTLCTEVFQLHSWAQVNAQDFGYDL
jgi:hypothetical protein